MVKLQKKSPKAATPKAKKVKAQPVKVVEEEESDSSEEESEEEAMEVQTTKAKPAKGKVTAEESDDDEDSDDEDDSDEDEDDSEESEAEGQNGKTVAAKPGKKEEDSDDDDDDEDEEESSEEESDEEEEETPAPKAATKRKAETKAAVPAKKAKAEEDDEEESDDDEEESDDEESDEEEEDSDEEEEDDEDEEEETPQQGKRKAKAAVEEESPAKKAKVEGEQTTLFVGNLTEDVTEEKLRKFFKKKGLEVLDLRYLTKSSGVSLAYVDIPAAEEAAGLELNGATLKGTELKVEKAKSKKQEPKSPGQNQSWGGDDKAARDAKTLFLRNLSYDSTKESIMEVFTDAVDVRIPTHQDTGRPKGIAFVEFESEAKVEEVKSSMDGVEVDGRSVGMDYCGGKATYSGKPPARSPGGFGSPAQASKTLIVKNLSYDTGEDDLQTAFEGCLSARIITDRESGRPKGFGYVDFDSEDAAKEALKNMDQQELGGRTLRLDFALPRGEGGGGRGARGLIEGCGTVRLDLYSRQPGVVWSCGTATMVGQQQYTRSGTPTVVHLPWNMRYTSPGMLTVVSVAVEAVAVVGDAVVVVEVVPASSVEKRATFLGSAPLVVVVEEEAVAASNAEKRATFPGSAPRVVVEAVSEGVVEVDVAAASEGVVVAEGVVVVAEEVRSGFQKPREGIKAFEGKKKTFDD
ncbi:NCL [Branchiostoma lanceolatum]|uniref:NCL protein n=1 Tax=Branchiostoma lanceolatum TaxID=7740 RepID=A0A8J9VGE1_BRALA|nr:NCL [Branchiostoma lanceolatum]